MNNVKFAFAKTAASVLLAVLLCATLGVQAFGVDNPDPFEDADTVGLPDGKYTVNVELSGGTGKAEVESPATMEVKDEDAVITLVWSSSYYDYMKVEDEKYLPLNATGNSTFTIPVTDSSGKMTVIADTTRMSQSHEIKYNLVVDLKSAVPLGNNNAAAAGSASVASNAGAGADVSPSASADSGEGAVANDAANPAADSSANAGSDAKAASGSNGEDPVLLLSLVFGILAASIAAFLAIGIRRNKEVL